MNIRSLIFLLSLPFCAYSQLNIDIEIDNGNLLEAVVLIDEALLNDPNNINYLIKKGVVLKKMEKYNESIACYLSAFEIDSVNARICNNLGELYKLEGQIDRSIKYFNHVLDLSPNNFFANNSLANIYYQRKNHKKALEFYLKLKDIDPESYSVFYNLGKTYYSMDSLDHAEACFLKSLELNKNHLNSILSLSNIYHKKEKLQKAVKILDDGLKMDSLNIKFNLKKANLLYLIREYKSAIPHFQNALNYGDTTELSIYKQLAVCLEQNLYYDEAIELLKKALFINDEDPMIYFYLGSIYSKIRKFQMSNEYFLKAIDLSIPENQIALYYASLGNNFYKQGNYKKSIQYLLQTLNYQPSRHSVLYDIAVIYEKDINDEKKAIEYYKLYLEKDTNAEESIKSYVEERIIKLRESIFFKGED